MLAPVVAVYWLISLAATLLLTPWLMLASIGGEGDSYYFQRLRYNFFATFLHIWKWIKGCDYWGLAIAIALVAGSVIFPASARSVLEDIFFYLLAPLGVAALGYVLIVFLIASIISPYILLVSIYEGEGEGDTYLLRVKNGFYRAIVRYTKYL